MIKNTYKKDSCFFLSYEMGVMIASAEESPTNLDMVDSIERVCKNMKLNIFVSANGYKHYFQENHLEIDTDEMLATFKKYGLKLDEQ